MGEFTYKTDHETEAQGLLLSQFASSTRLLGLVGVIGERAQDAEDVDNALYSERGVETSVGAQLTAVGDIVGEPRASRADAAYRPWVKARIAVNNSEGTHRDLYGIARLLLGDAPTLQIVQVPPAAYLFEISAGALDWSWGGGTPDDVAADLADILIEATSGGVGLQLIYQNDEDANMFAFASGDTEEDDAVAGMSDDDDETGGGNLVGLEERT